jgi:anti-sigma regulatory factor (Ser/Thr protein kinase)
MTTTGSPLAGRNDEPIAFVDRVELALPARPELLFLARMTAAAVASRADFGYDRIEDLRLALDELCLTLLGGTLDDRRIRLQFRWNEDTIEVSATLEGGADWESSAARGPGRDLGGGSGQEGTSSLEDADSGDPPTGEPTPPTAPNDLSERILDALVDEHGFEQIAGTPSSWMRMRRGESA